MQNTTSDVELQKQELIKSCRNTNINLCEELKQKRESTPFCATTIVESIYLRYLLPQAERGYGGVILKVSRLLSLQGRCSSPESRYLVEEILEEIEKQYSNADGKLIYDIELLSLEGDENNPYRSLSVKIIWDKTRQVAKESANGNIRLGTLSLTVPKELLEKEKIYF